MVGFGATSRREAEFTAFVASASRYLARTAYLLTGSQDLADELVQEALTRTYAAWDRVRLDDATSYARRVLVNVSIDHRRRRRPIPVEWAAERPSGEWPQSRVDDRDEVARMLATLTPKQRRIVVLRYFDDYTEAQTAECLGITVGAVKSACSRALAGLRDAVASTTEGAES
ncbi:MAG: SigE family RNA polymerase sigma factor [Micropruina sp.]|uniref:SigE family RNA polymerase sigma factor n=1 Tax=Micropruina sp. TaxID=2737536 RepID=UPI0039E2F7DE